MRDAMEIVNELFLAKQQEELAKNKRITLENELAEVMQIPPQWEGSKTLPAGIYKVKISRKMNITINADKLREIAHNNGLDDRLNTYFRWKPEINKKIWNDAPENERTTFMMAMDSKPGKASFTIEKERDEFPGEEFF